MNIMLLTIEDFRWLLTPMISIATPNQIRAARGLLGWSQSELAANARVHPQTVSFVEREDGPRYFPSRVKIQECLENAGILFIAESDGIGDGVRFRKMASERLIDASDKGQATS